MNMRVLGLATALACSAISFAAPAQGATCVKPARGKLVASNSYGAIYSESGRLGQGRKKWYGCSYRFGRTRGLNVSERYDEVSATVKPEFIRLRFVDADPESFEGCDTETIRVTSFSMSSSRSRQLYYQNCRRSDGDRKYKNHRLGILLQRGE